MERFDCTLNLRGSQSWVFRYCPPYILDRFRYNGLRRAGMVTPVIHEYGYFFPHYISPGKARHIPSFATTHFTQLAFVVELCTVDYAEFLFELALWVDASVRTLAIGIPYFPKGLPLCL